MTCMSQKKKLRLTEVSLYVVEKGHAPGLAGPIPPLANLQGGCEDQMRFSKKRWQQGVCVCMGGVIARLGTGVEEGQTCGDLGYHLGG